MARLKTLPSRLSKLAPALGYLDAPTQPVDATRTFFAPWRKLYGTVRWKETRLRIFERDRFTCQRPGCGFMTGNTSRLMCDHREPHRGDERLFWDEDNLQTLCKPCHDRHKQREERRG